MFTELAGRAPLWLLGGTTELESVELAAVSLEVLVDWSVVLLSVREKKVQNT